MSSPVPPQRIHIRSAPDLLAALRESSPLLRLGVLQHVARHPQKALAYGKHEGLDVLDVLVEQARSMPAGQLRQATVLAIANFRDPRAVAFLMEDVRTNPDAQSVMSTLIRLAEEESEPVRRLLVELLDREPSSAHARTAANLLSWWPGWEPTLEQRLRLSLLSDTGRPQPPPFDEESADLWLAHLQGELASRAWDYLELQGRGAFARVGMRWDDLEDEQRLALLRWGGRRHLEDVPGLLRQTLASANPELVHEALRLLERLPGEQGRHQERLRQLWEQGGTDARRAVLRAGLRGLEWERLLSEAADLPLRRELLAAWARHEPVAALPHVLEAFEAREWQVRATAVQLAIAAGEPAVEGARRWALDPRPEVRLAACQALVGLGQEEWLEETLL